MGGWSDISIAFRSVAVRSFTLYGAWWTELLSVATGNISVRVAEDSSGELHSRPEPALYRDSPLSMGDHSPLARRIRPQSSVISVTTLVPTGAWLTLAFLLMTTTVTIK